MERHPLITKIYNLAADHKFNVTWISATSFKVDCYVDNRAMKVIDEELSRHLNIIERTAIDIRIKNRTPTVSLMYKSDKYPLDEVTISIKEGFY